MVTGVTLVMLYGPQSALGSWLNHTFGLRLIFAPPGIILALLFLAFPFVVRTVQPVLQSLNHDQEAAAATLGAGVWTILRRIVLPPLAMPLISATLPSFARVIDEFGAIVIVAGNLPLDSQTAAVYVFGEIEASNQRSLDRHAPDRIWASAAGRLSPAASSTTGGGETTMSAIIDPEMGWPVTTAGTWRRRILIGMVVAYIAVLILAPIGALMRGPFAQELSPMFIALNDSDVLSVFWRTLLIAAITIVVQVTCGTALAWVLVRHRFPGRQLLNGLLDLPFAISSVVAGRMLILPFGRPDLFAS